MVLSSLGTFHLQWLYSSLLERRNINKFQLMEWKLENMLPTNQFNEL